MEENWTEADERNLVQLEKDAECLREIKNRVYSSRINRIAMLLGCDFNTAEDVYVLRETLAKMFSAWPAP